MSSKKGAAHSSTPKNSLPLLFPTADNFTIRTGGGKEPCLLNKGIFSVEDDALAVRLYRINKCTGKILKQLYKNEKSIDIISQIYDGKNFYRTRSARSNHQIF